MGLFDAFREDVDRVGALLAPVLGGSLTGPGDDKITWSIGGTRGGRSVRVELNQMQGVFGVACSIRQLPVDRVTLHDETSIFAGDNPTIAPKLTMGTSYDAAALWALLPDTTRHVIVDMLSAAGSSMRLGSRELSMLLGPAGLLRQPAAPDVLVRQLDRLLSVAAAMELHWDVDPRGVGAGRSTHVPRPQPAPPPPLSSQPVDAAEIAAHVRSARDAMLERYAAQRMELFPAANAMHDRDRVRGKVVVLPATPPSAWSSSFQHKVVSAGEVEYGWYFARTDDPGFSRVVRAGDRYERATSTKLGDAAYELIAEISGEPMLAVVAGKLQVGHQLKVLGASIGGRVFVDATSVEGVDSRFAGEHA